MVENAQGGEHWQEWVVRTLREGREQIERDQVALIDRAVSFLGSGVPLPLVLEGLGISESTWWRRLKARAQRQP